MMQRAAMLVAGLVALCGTWAQANQIAYPKSFGVDEILLSTDLNAQFNAISSVVNGNLDGGNVRNGTLTSDDLSTTAGITAQQIANGTLTTADLSATAGILGSQLSATAGLVSGQITDGTLVQADMALHATNPVFASGVFTSGTFAIQVSDGNSAESAAIATIGPLVTRGGRVMLMASHGLYAQVTRNPLPVVGSCVAIIRVRRISTIGANPPVTTILNEQRVLLNVDAGDTYGQSALPGIALIDSAPAAGSHVYTVQVQTSVLAGNPTCSIGSGLSGIGAGQAYAVELS